MDKRLMILQKEYASLKQKKIKIKAENYLELLALELIKSIGSTKNKISMDENG